MRAIIIITLMIRHTSSLPLSHAPTFLVQVAIITGAGQGVGKAAALLFAQHGAKVVLSDIDGEKVQAVADFVRNGGGSAIVVAGASVVERVLVCICRQFSPNPPHAPAGDVTAADFPQRIVTAALGAYGAIHILLNNAGFTWDGVIHKMGAKQWEAMLAVHLTAPFRLIQAAGGAMRDAAKRELDAGGSAAPRSILNVSSVSGMHGAAGQANYAAAKAGVVGLTKSVAKVRWHGTLDVEEVL